MTQKELPVPVPLQSPLVESFAISIWFSCLFAVSFSGAVFGLYGTPAALGMLFIGFFACLISLWFAYRNRHIKDALKVPADTLAILGLIFFVITYVETNLITALIEMLFFLQLALNLYFREHRQVYFGLIVCFVALMSGALYTFKTGYLLFIFLFCVCACFYMALSYVDKQISLTTSASQKATLKQAQSTPSQTASPRLSSTFHTAIYGKWTPFERIGVALLISLFAGIIYLVMPRFPAGGMGQLPLEGWGNYDQAQFEKQLLPESASLKDNFYNTPHDAEKPHPDAPEPDDQDNDASSTQGTSDNGSRTQYLHDDSIYFYIRSNRSRYLQINVKTYFDGASWYALQYGRKRLHEEQRLFWLYAGEPNATIDINVVKDTPEHIVTTDNALAINFPTRNLGRDYYDNLKTGTTLKKDTFYQLHVHDEYRNNRLIDTHQALPDKRDLQLPKYLDPRIAELASRVTAGAQTDWEKAQALEHHLRHSYQYTLETLWNQNNIPLTDFLFGEKTGHCEYFATAMAMMLRSQGIPARYVTGFVAEDYNPVTGYYEVKGTNGHAWVEAYVGGVWAIFEATGAYQPPKEHANDTSTPEGNVDPQHQNTSTAHQQLKDYLENLSKQEKNLEDTQDDPHKTIASYLRDFWYALLVGLESLWQAVATVVRHAGWLLLMLGIAGVVLYRYWQQHKTHWLDKRSRHSLSHLNETEPDKLVKSAMHHIQSLLLRHGITRANGMTLPEFAKQLQQQKLISPEQCDTLIEIVSQHFYRDNTGELSTEEHHQLHAFFMQLYDDMYDRLYG